MPKLTRRLLALVMLSSLAPALAAADCPNRADGLALLGADIHGDGQPDFLVRAKPNYLPLELDEDARFVIPVPMPIHGFTLMSVGAGYEPSRLAPHEPVASVWAPAAGAVYVADVRNSGSASVVVRPAVGTRGFLVGYDAEQNPYLIQQFGGRRARPTILRAPRWRSRTEDSDARADLEVSRSGAVQAIYLAQGDGVLRIDPSASALAV